MGHWLGLLPAHRRARLAARDAAREEAAPGPAPPPPSGPRLAYATGLDLGQVQDFTALAVVERTREPDKPDLYDVRHLHRWPLGTPYPQIVEDVRGWFAAEPLKGSALVVDETGVGRPVVDVFRKAGIAAHLRPFTITGGEVGTGSTVPKKNLVGAIQVPLQERRLRFAADLELTPVLQRELEQFRVKVTAARNEVFEAWRERDHDDLVLALALAVYVAAFPSGGISFNGRPV